MSGGTKGPFRTHDDRGRQIVQVSFPGSFRVYAYLAPDGVTLTVGDMVRVPPNAYNPDVSQARVRRLGSEYSGELAQLLGEPGTADADTLEMQVVHNAVDSDDPDEPAWTLGHP